MTLAHASASLPAVPARCLDCVAERTVSSRYKNRVTVMCAACGGGVALTKW